jgi:hypothetical protein
VILLLDAAGIDHRARIITVSHAQGSVGEAPQDSGRFLWGCMSLFEHYRRRMAPPTLA